MSASVFGIACLCLVAWIHGATVGVAFGDEMLSQWIVMTCVICLPSLALITYSQKTRRLAASILYFFISGYVMSIVSAFCWYRWVLLAGAVIAVCPFIVNLMNTNPKDAPMLPDIGHEVFPHIREFRIPGWHADGEYVDARTLPDIFITFLVVSSLGFVMLNHERVTLLRRFFTIYSTLMLMRSITIAVTTLPDSLPICQEMTPGTQPWYEINPRQVILRALKMSLPIGELSCGDLAVSGHSIILVMCAMLWHTYYPSVRGMNVVKFFMWLVCYAGLFAILLVRLHYTLDIILAVYLTITVWCQYHRIAHDVITGDSFQMVWLVDGLFVYPLVSWMEEGAPPIPKILLHEATADDSIVPTFKPKNSKGPKAAFGGQRSRSNTCPPGSPLLPLAAQQKVASAVSISTATAAVASDSVFRMSSLPTMTLDPDAQAKGQGPVCSEETADDGLKRTKRKEQPEQVVEDAGAGGERRAAVVESKQ